MGLLTDVCYDTTRLYILCTGQNLHTLSLSQYYDRALPLAEGQRATGLLSEMVYKI